MYSLTRVPKNATWDDHWFPSAFAVNGNPIALRVVGSVVEVDVHGLRTNGASVSVVLDLVRGVDHDALVKLIKKGDSQCGTHVHATSDGELTEPHRDLPAAHASYATSAWSGRGEHALLTAAERDG